MMSDPTIRTGVTSGTRSAVILSTCALARTFVKSVSLGHRAKQASARQHPQPLRDVGPDRKPQTRLIAGAQCRQNEAMVLGHFGPAEATIELAHCRSQLEPNRFRHSQHRGCLSPEVKRPMKVKIGADIGNSVFFDDS